MRLFVALDIDDAVRACIARFLDGVCEFAPDARWVKPESLHVTLKFIGEKPEGSLPALQNTLSAVQAQPTQLTFRGHGFFPTPKAPRVFWLGIEAGPELAKLAASVDDATATLGIPKEEHTYTPHLTLARGGRGSGAPGWRKGDRPNQTFQRLQEKLAALPPPEFGTMTAREFFLYQSQTGPGGARYTKLAAFGLR